MSQAPTYNGEKNVTVPTRILQEWGRRPARKDPVSISTVLYANGKWEYLSQSSWAKGIKLTTNKR